MEKVPGSNPGLSSFFGSHGRFSNFLKKPIDAFGNGLSSDMLYEVLASLCGEIWWFEVGAFDEILVKSRKLRLPFELQTCKRANGVHGGVITYNLSIGGRYVLFGKFCGHCVHLSSHHSHLAQAGFWAEVILLAASLHLSFSDIHCQTSLNS